DLDEYLLALNNDTYSTTEALEVLNPISIDDITLEQKYVSGENNSNNNQFDFSLAPAATLPTTGYGTLRYVGNRKKINMLITATAAAGAALTAFLFPAAGAATGIAFAKAVLSKGIAAGVIAYGTQAITSNVYYDIYQALHNSNNGAVKEQRRPYTQIQNLKIYGNSYTSYFWSVRPY